MIDGRLTPDSKLTEEQKEELARRFVAGETGKALGEAFGIAKSTVYKILRKMGVEKPDLAPASALELVQFASRARSILWRQDPGLDKKTYDAWNTRVTELESPDGGGYSRSQAVVRASKEYPCLHRLFREYNLSAFDPNPDSHPTIKQQGKPIADAQVMSEGIDLSYRDSLRWAIDAAGKYLRTNEMPATCPCDQAFFLFRQAIEEPKDFMAKVGQIESKADADSEAMKNSRKASGRSIMEIDSMLAELDEERTDEA